MVVTNLDRVTVTAQYLDYDGTPLTGSVVFTPSTVLVDATGKKILYPKAYTASLNASGQISISIPASGDPDIIPSNFVYSVKENISGGRTFSNIQIPYAYVGSSFDLSQILQDGSSVSPAVYSGTTDATTLVKGILRLAGDLGGTATSPTTPTAVHLTGAETVAGVKTFSSSPIIPVPTTASQAASKTYVDTNFMLKDLPNAVTDFGADPTGVADSAAALNSWMANALSRKRAGYLPPGNYKINSTLQVNGTVGCPGIIGTPGMSIAASFAGTRIFWGGAVGGTMVEINNIRSAPFFDFELDGVGVAAIGIDYGGPITTGLTTSRCYFERVGVYNCTSKGVRVGKGHLQADLTSWKDCIFQGCGTGVSFEWSQAVNHTFYSCAFASNTIAVDETFDVGSSGQFDMFGCAFGSNTPGQHTPALRLSNTRQHTIVAAIMEGGGYFLQGPGGSAATSPCLLIGCSVNTLTEPGGNGSGTHDGIGIKWPGRSPLVIMGGFFKTGRANGFTIDAGVGGGLTPVVLIGATFPDNQPVFPGTATSSQIYNINAVYQDSGVSSMISGGDFVPVGTPAIPFGTVNAVAASAPQANFSGAVWLKVASGTALTTGLNTFYVKSQLCNGKASIAINIYSVGGANTQLLGIHGQDNNGSTANTAAIIIRVSGNVTLTSDLVFKVIFSNEPTVQT